MIIFAFILFFLAGVNCAFALMHTWNRTPLAVPGYILTGICLFFAVAVCWMDGIL